MYRGQHEHEHDRIAAEHGDLVDAGQRAHEAPRQHQHGRLVVDDGVPMDSIRHAHIVQNKHLLDRLDAANSSTARSLTPANTRP